MSVDLTSIGLSSAASLRATGQQSLGQAEFLKLMTTQLQHQDPFKPMESGEFLGQMAQFSTVSGIQELQKSFASLSSSLQADQRLQAAGLVGRGVLAPGENTWLFADGGASGAADLVASGGLLVEVLDEAGAVVRRMDLGTRPAGLAEFDWDGLDESGARLPEGRYRFRTSLVQGSQTSAAQTYAVGLVQSVSIGPQGLSLNRYGLDPVALDQVRQIL
ncbi:MAG TPA: flagellar hook assembly protein FlgD [Nevskiaceae bacterium]|nr:flagellar hook assembly protein FlgD [Nevskiaceae bacterium]